MVEVSTKLRIGDVMNDGTIYAGISPRTGAVMFVYREEGPTRMHAEDMEAAAKNLAPFGWRQQPTRKWAWPTSEEIHYRLHGEIRDGHGGWQKSKNLSEEFETSVFVMTREPQTEYEGRVERQKDAPKSNGPS